MLVQLVNQVQIELNVFRVIWSLKLRKYDRRYIKSCVIGDGCSSLLYVKVRGLQFSSGLDSVLYVVLQIWTNAPRLSSADDSADRATKFERTKYL